MVGPYLLSVIMGSILALIVNPVYVRCRKKYKPGISAAIVTLGLAVVFIAPLGLFTTLAVKEGIHMGQMVAERDDFSLASITSRLGDWEILRSVLGDTTSLDQQLRQGIKQGSQSASKLVLGIASGIPAILLQLVLLLLTCFFMLQDGRTFFAWMTNKVPLDHDVRVKLISSFRETAISVVWAGLAAAAAQAACMTFAFLILAVPAAFLAGGATFIFSWVPILGSVPVWMIGAIYLYVQGSVAKTIIMILIGLLTGVVDNLIRPMVLQGRSDMHPLVSLVAIFGGIELFGIFGVFIGPIVVAILIALLQTWPAIGNRFGFRFGSHVTVVEGNIGSESKD